MNQVNLLHCNNDWITTVGMTQFWNYITDFGDSSVTLPLAAFLLLYLLAVQRWRSALAWGLAVGSCGLAMAMLKLVFQSCEPLLASKDFTSASGHSAMSTMVYGGCALLLTTRPAAWPRVATGAIALALVAMIAVSRVIIGAHRPLEVMAGLLVGLMAVLLLRRLQEQATTRLPIMLPALGGLALILLMHGTRWPIEEHIHALARLIGAGISACHQPG
jgi:membrane-associated phospholipid phosphatase